MLKSSHSHMSETKYSWIPFNCLKISEIFQKDFLVQITMVICIKGIIKNDLRKSLKIIVLIEVAIYNFRTNNNYKIKMLPVPIREVTVQSINMNSNSNLLRMMVITRKQVNKWVKISQYQQNLNIQNLPVNKVPKYKGAEQIHRPQIIIMMLVKIALKIKKK